MRWLLILVLLASCGVYYPNRRWCSEGWRGQRWVLVDGPCYRHWWYHHHHQPGWYP